jgi:hypothetical protein
MTARSFSVYNKFLLSVLLFSFGAIEGCHWQEPVVDDARVCDYRVISATGACRVSVINLLSRSRDYSGKTVDIVAYYPASGSLFVYSGRDAAQVADLPSAIMISAEDAGRKFTSQGYYRIEGVFLESAPISFGEGVTVPEVVGGRLSSINAASRVASKDELIQECVEEGCGVIYADGAFLMKTLP